MLSYFQSYDCAGSVCDYHALDFESNFRSTRFDTHLKKIRLLRKFNESNFFVLDFISPSKKHKNVQQFSGVDKINKLLHGSEAPTVTILGHLVDG